MACRKPYLILILLCLLINLQAQVSQGGRPFPYFPDKKAGTYTIILKGFDMQKAILKSLSQEAVDGKKPFQFAFNQEVSFSPLNSGYWSDMKGGMRIWRLEIVSPGAYAINAYFKKFRLNKNCMLFAFSPDQSRILGGFNEKNILPDGNLPLSFIPGETLVFELQVPSGMDDFGELELESIGHDYINVFGRKTTEDGNYKASKSCNIDINCPDGYDFQIVKRSVCRLIIKKSGLTELCTGTLINTSHKDTHPYLLTANHCITNATHAANTVFYFDYESESCNGADDTTTVYSLSGCKLLATSDSLDFSLIKLSSQIPVEYKPYYAGWTISPTPPSNAVCIHHPKGDVKKISTEIDPVVKDYQAVDPPYWLIYESVTKAFWRVRHYEKGTTEGGSSGAPIFNQNRKIVGNLTGGEDADCGFTINDYFSTINMAWNYYPDSSRQLRFWLDSLNTGITELDGSEYIGPEPITYSDRYALFPNPANNIVTFETDSLEIRGARISIYNFYGARLADYIIQNEKRINMDISFLEPGLYIVEYRNNGVNIRKRLLIIR